MIVVHVAHEGQAHNAGICKGDKLIGINEKPLTTYMAEPFVIDDFKALMKAAQGRANLYFNKFPAKPKPPQPPAPRPELCNPMWAVLGFFAVVTAIIAGTNCGIDGCDHPKFT